MQQETQLLTHIEEAHIMTSLVKLLGNFDSCLHAS